MDNIESIDNNCEHCRKKHRTDAEYKALSNRLSRIEGQIRGIKGMIERDAYCPDILIQVSAVNAALEAFSRELLSEHIRTCVVEDIKSGKQDTADELVSLLKRIL